MKQQKSILRTLTNRGFKSSKTRNLIAIFAIVLTTVMFTSLFVLSQSMVENIKAMNFQQAGYNSHLSSSPMTDAQMEQLLAHPAIYRHGISRILGVAENKELTGRQVELRYGDEPYARSCFSYPTAGSMTMQENEIALDTLPLDKLGLSHELGQEITLQWRKDLATDAYTTSSFVLSGYWDGNSAAMEAVRYTDTDTTSKRRFKKSTGGTSIPRMALANLGRNKKRTVTVICSLTLGLVLLCCVYAKKRQL